MSENNNKNWLHNTNTEAEPTFFGAVIVVLLCVTLVIATIAFGSVDLWALALLSLSTALIGILWVTDSWKLGEFRFSSSLLQVPLIGMILIGFIQLLPFRNANISNDLLAIPARNSLSFDPNATGFSIIQIIIYLVFFAALLTFLDSHKRLKKVAYTITIFGTIMAFYAIIQRIANLDAIYGVRQTFQAIPFGSFINQHHFASFMEMTLGVTIGILLGTTVKKEQLFLFIFAIILMIVCIVFTGSRGGILSLCGLLGFIGLSFYFTRTKNETLQINKLAVFVGVLALIFVIFGGVLFLGADSSLMRGIGVVGGDDISNGRTHFWQIATQMFFNYPILGVGLDSFGVAFTKFDTWNGNFRIEQAHNEYLQVLAESGIIGFACVAAFIFFLFKQSFAVIKQTHDKFRRGIAIGSLAGCFGILIHSFFDFPLRTPSNMLVFLMLAGLATISLHSKHTNRKIISNKI
jgi:O-antigen ligase